MKRATAKIASMSEPHDEDAADLPGSAFQPIGYRGVRIDREVAGRIGKPPGRPLYQYWCEVYRRRLARPTLDELKKAIDEAVG
ncbi:MAG TPA: hypothetical protein VG125_28765 [Pirellulales bacterium]|jgi:hypothetical protein|nr:hypothetical protein [Pirellulales bacterium]